MFALPTLKLYHINLPKMGWPLKTMSRTRKSGNKSYFFLKYSAICPAYELWFGILTYCTTSHYYVLLKVALLTIYYFLWFDLYTSYIKGFYFAFNIDQECLFLEVNKFYFSSEQNILVQYWAQYWVMCSPDFRGRLWDE